MPKEILIKHKEISDPQTITGVMERKFAEAGCDVMKHEHTSVEDDFDKGVRKVTINNKKVFAVPDLPWLKERK